jgi:hypothetical protein
MEQTVTLATCLVKRYTPKTVRGKVSNPLLVTATAIIGLIAFPLLQPGWVFVK